MEAPAVPNLTAPRPTPPGRRDLATLPKAHLHLHFTGAMRPSTMIDMARTQGVRLPPHLLHIDAASMPADGRGWFRFQRAYDSARHLVRSEAAMRRLIREAAEDDAAEGSVRMEIQADPTSYAPYVGGITPALEIIIDEARSASRDTGVDIGVIVAASRIEAPAGRAHSRTPSRVVRGRRPRRGRGFWPIERRARGVHGFVWSRVPHRAPRRARGRSARR